MLTHRHQDAAASASVALAGLLASTGGSTPGTVKTLTAHHPDHDGTSLVEVEKLANAVGFAGRMAYRMKNVEPIAPSILHLNLGHYAALVKIENGFYFVRDAILGDRWISRQALDDEHSGYFLILKQVPLSGGWRAVEKNEGAAVNGHCAPGAADGQDPGGPGSPRTVRTANASRGCRPTTSIR